MPASGASTPTGDVMNQPMPAFDWKKRPPAALRPAARFRRYRPASRDAGIGALYWLTVLAAACVSITCVAVGLSSPRLEVEAENFLNADLPTPKLSIIRSEEPVAPAPAGPEPIAQAPVRTTVGRPEIPQPPPAADVKPEPAVAPAPVVPRIVEVVPVAAYSEANSDPAVYLPSREPTFGESPMIRTWKTLALAAVLAAAAPPPAAVAGGGENDTQKMLRQLGEKLDALTSKVNTLPGKQDILNEIKKLDDKIAEQIANAKKDLKGEITGVQIKQDLALQNMNARMRALEEDLTMLAEKMVNLRKQILADTPTTTANNDDVRGRLAAIEKAMAALANGDRSKSFFPPSTTSNFASPSSLGRILLTNLYTESVLFTVNDRPYRVEPNQSVELREMPAGAVTYEVFADRWGMIRPRTTTSLLPNQTLTLFAK
jgi:hypothetical protein